MNQIEYRKKAWRSYGSDYAKDHSREEKIEKEIFWIINLLNPKKRENVLDIGCNTGELCHILSKNYNIYAEGVDINESAINIAKKRYPKLRFFAGNINNIKIRKRYDVVIMMQVIEHLEEPEKMLKTVKEHLEDNGRIIISTPNKWAFVDKLKCKAVGKKFAYDPTHVQLFNPPNLKKLLENNGFTIEKIITRGTCLIPFLEKKFNLGWHFPNWLIGSTIILSAKKRVIARQLERRNAPLHK